MLQNTPDDVVLWIMGHVSERDRLRLLCTCTGMGWLRSLRRSTAQEAMKRFCSMNGSQDGMVLLRRVQENGLVDHATITLEPNFLVCIRRIVGMRHGRKIPVSPLYLSPWSWTEIWINGDERPAELLQLDEDVEQLVACSTREIC